MNDPTDLVDRLRERLGPAGLLTGLDEMRPYLIDWRALWRGRALAVARPASTAEAAETIRLCRAARRPVTVQGGNTGLVGGSVPGEEDGGEPGILLSTARLLEPLELDRESATLTVGAGVTLARAEAAANAAGLRVGLRLGSEGTAQIGGLVATNAGGSHAMRFGMMRARVLGVEAVLPDGTVFDGLTRLRKDNFGWDVSQLFIGSEGAFGLVTAASLALEPLPGGVATALVALRALDALPALVAAGRARLGPDLERVEFMSGTGIALAAEHLPETPRPLEPVPKWSALIEVAGDDVEATEKALADLIEALFEDGIASDGVLAASLAQSTELWALREAVVEGQRLHGPQLKHDVAVPPGRLPAFVRETAAALESAHAGLLINPFGHAGDGNVHFNVSPGGTVDAGRDAAITETVYRLAREHGGTIAAEHGVGRLKRERYLAALDPARRTVLTALRARLDPDGLFNPHILPLAGRDSAS